MGIDHFFTEYWQEENLNEMSTATIELSSTRRKLFDVLGDNQQQYLDHLKVFSFSPPIVMKSAF